MWRLQMQRTSEDENPPLPPIHVATNLDNRPWAVRIAELQTTIRHLLEHEDMYKEKSLSSLNPLNLDTRPWPEKIVELQAITRHLLDYPPQLQLAKTPALDTRPWETRIAEVQTTIRHLLRQSQTQLASPFTRLTAYPEADPDTYPSSGKRPVRGSAKVPFPQSRVPFEILSEIFKWYVVIQKDHPGPWLLVGICRAWRSIAFGTPRLWSAVRVVNPLAEAGSADHPLPQWRYGDGRENCITVSHMKMLLSRAKSAPLDIAIDNRYPSKEVDWSPFDEMLQLLGGERLNQWRSIEITGNFKKDHVALDRVFDDTGELKGLEVVNLWGRCDPLLANIRQHSRRIHTIIFRQDPVFLTDSNIEDSKSLGHDLAEIVPVCPNLESLQIRGVSVSNENLKAIAQLRSPRMWEMYLGRGLLDKSLLFSTLR